MIHKLGFHRFSTESAISHSNGLTLLPILSDGSPLSPARPAASGAMVVSTSPKARPIGYTDQLTGRDDSSGWLGFGRCNRRGHGVCCRVEEGKPIKRPHVTKPCGSQNASRAVI